MQQNDFSFQPGSMLHDAVVGAFRAGGRSFELWCSENGVHSGVARNATFGQSRGPTGRALLERIIEAAGRDVVRAAYVARMERHCREVLKGAA